MPNRSSDVTRSGSLSDSHSLSFYLLLTLLLSLSLLPLALALLLSLLEKRFRFRAQSLVENLVRCSLRSNCCVYVKLQPVEACRLNENENGKLQAVQNCKTENRRKRKQPQNTFLSAFFVCNFALCVCLSVFLRSAVFLVFLATLFTRQCCFSFLVSSSHLATAGLPNWIRNTRQKMRNTFYFSAYAESVNIAAS